MKQPKAQTAWAYYNYQILQGTACTRKQAILDVEHLTGAPWSDAKRYMQVLKVSVVPVVKE